MKLKLQHIIGICLVLCGWLGFASCTDESFESPREEEDNSIFLTFRTAVAGASTRNPDGSSEADAEIRQLLVVIVSEEKTEESTGSAGNATQWVVEHSRLITKGASIGIPLSDEYTFEVTTGCRKRIYLIANHKGLKKDAAGNPLDFGSSFFIPDESGIAPVEDFVFALNLKDDENGYKYNPDEYGIPMTAMYEINVPAIKDLPENTDEYKLGDLYVVRAATKYSFNFKNTSAHRNIQVNSVDIEKVITDRMYLMPHVNKEADNEDGTDKYWVVSDKTNKKNYLQNKTNSWFTNREWIDWMVVEAAETNGDATLPDTGEEEWLTDYKVPDGETSTYNMKYTDPVKVPANTDKKENLDFVSSPEYFYLPESCSQENEPDEQKRQLKLQKYTLTVHTTETFEGNGNKNSREKSYTAPLPHLASLFRNTHVKVNIVFNDYDVDWQVDVEPYWEVKLDPEFGLDVPDTTTPEQPTNPDPSGDNSGE